MLFKLIYKKIIIVYNINNALHNLNIISSKETKNIIDKLINLTKTDQKISKSFSSKTIIAFSILFTEFASIIFNKLIELFTKVFRTMYLNNTCAITVDNI